MLDNITTYTDNNNNNILNLIIKRNNIKLMKNTLEKLLKYGSLSDIINKPNNQGNTPLHLAVKNNRVPLTNILLDYGAIKAIPNINGNTIQLGGNKNISYKGKRYL